MKKLMLLFIGLLILPTVHSWRWDTHKMFVENFYENLPTELQQNLNLSLMKFSSIVPDEIFQDNIYHHYPPSLELANAWLEATEEEYNLGHYDNASISFGIATHYISDSFAAPHYVASERWELHSEFEAQVDFYKAKTRCKKKELNLKEALEEGSKNKEEWKLWKKTRNERIPQQEVDEAMKTVFAAGLKVFNTECKKESLLKRIPLKLIIAFILGIILVVILVIKPYKKKAKSS